MHVPGQKNFTFLNLPVTLSFVPLTFFLHLLLGFSATNKSHVNFFLSLNRNVFKFSHLPRGVLHFFLHVPGQKSLILFPPVLATFFLHRLLVFSATYESHVFDKLPLYVKSGSFEQLGPALLGSRLGIELGASLGAKLGMKLGTALGDGLGKELGAKLILGSTVAVGTVLGIGLVLGALLKLGTALGNELGEKLGKKLGSIDVLGLELGKELGSSLGGKITVAFIPWSVSKSLANFPEEIASSISPTAF